MPGTMPRTAVKDTMLSFRLSSHLLEGLRQVADERHQSLSDCLTEAVRAYVRRHALEQQPKPKSRRPRTA
jgi:predicted transcriptional regulator